MGLRELLIRLEAVNIIPSEYSDWTEPSTFTTAKDNIAPAAPTMTASNGDDQCILLVLAAPSLDSDGSTNKDFSHFKVYYREDDGGVIITDPSFDTTSTHHSYITSARTWFKAAAVDIWGNESVLSAEDDGTPASSAGDVVITNVSNISGVYLGASANGLTFITPPNTWIGFSHFEVEYDVQSSPYVVGDASFVTLNVDGVTPTEANLGLVHKDLDNTLLYAYRSRAVARDGTANDWYVDDNATAGYLPDEDDNVFITDFGILAQNITGIDEVRGEHIYAGSTIEIASGGHIRSGQTAYDTGIGWWLGDDGGTIKFSIGNSAGNKLLWTGTALEITGKVTASSGAIGGFTIATHLYTGSKTAYNDANAGVHLGTDGIGFGNNVFTVSAAGALVASSAEVSGKITMGTGSTLSGSYITAGTVTASKLYINGHLNFAADASRHYIYGIDALLFSTSASTSEAWLGLSSHGVEMYTGTNPLTSSWITLSTDDVTIAAGTTSGVMNLSAGGAIKIDSGASTVELEAAHSITIDAGRDIFMHAGNTAYHIFLSNLPTSDPEEVGALYAPTSYVRISQG